ncbi:hypothetical protein ACHAXR_009163 [Thalassiosira sp. AJA248-18]
MAAYGSGASQAGRVPSAECRASPEPQKMKYIPTTGTMATTPSNPGYQTIPSSEGEEPMELSRDSSSSNDSDGNGSGPRKLGHTLAMAASATLILLLAFLGGRRSSSKATSTKLFPHDAQLNEAVPNRLCEIYHDKGDTTDIRIIQTSMGEPSKQWSEVACVHRQRKLHTSSQQSDEDGGYARPSAVINVDFSSVAFPDREPILGFGGAFTEAAALNFWSLNEEGRKVALELLFGRDGLGYSLGRTHINSCDFCVKSYSFDDTDGDFNLDNFDTEVTHDLDSGMIDMMLLATKTIKESYPKEHEYGMRIIASPWSPPPWMKAPTYNDVKGALHAENMTGSAQPVCIRDGVGSDSKYAKSWALFFSKFISAYSNHGIDFYGITIQNEPEFPAPWDACAYDPFSEGEFIANHLGPTLAESHPDTKILIFDHNKDHIVKWAQFLLNSNHAASKYIDGTAFHWYAGGMDRLLDGAQGIPNLHRLISELDVMNVDKGHILLGSEACHCPSTGYAGGDLGIAWARASRNAHTLLADLAAGSNGFIEWNLILDSVGGPNHLGNMCDSPLLAVPHRALDADGIPHQLDFETAGHPFGEIHGDSKTREELNAEGVPSKYLDLGIVVQPMYYYVGHLTRFVRPGSRAVHGLVDSSVGRLKSRTFRPKEQEVAGGGINDLARNGIEVTLWPCEGSTRQEWLLNEDKQLQVFGHDWLGVPTASCLGRKADKDMGGLMLTTCNVTEDKSGLYEVVLLAEKHRANIVMKNGKADSKKSCLVAQPLRNIGGAYGPRGGAQVNIGSCEQPWAEWVIDPSTGEIYSTVFDEFGGEVCLTTGWPFLQVGAFDTAATGNTARAAVVLNEAGESANYVFKDKGKTILTASIPPHSIQTIEFDGVE